MAGAGRDDDALGATIGALGQTLGATPGDRPEAGPLLGERYRILARLGEGGMGTVHLAVDTVLGVEVALKVVGSSVLGAKTPAGGAGSSGLRELRDEVLLAQRITHENVCRTFDLEAVEGQWVVKMEYVRGETLAARLSREKRLALTDVLVITRQLVEGLDASHRRGVVHRDLKPHNVMLEHGTGRAVIMDFGIARTHTHGDDRITGTPHYMAPEQARGEAVDGRADLYSLGCLLFEMLTGEVLFPADTVRAIAIRHATDAPPDLRARVPDAPAWLASLLLALLEKDRERRPADARAVAVLLAGPRWTPEIVPLRAYASENSDRPALSPDGSRLAYRSDRERRNTFRLYVEPVAGGASRALTPPDLSVGDPTWSADGKTLVFSASDGRARRIDADGGAAEIIAEGVHGAVECEGGLLLMRSSAGGTRFVIRDPQGTEREVHVSPTPVEAVRVDREGRRAVYARRMPGAGPHPPADLWMFELADGSARPLTHDGLENSRGVFHPDGKSVIFSSSRAGQLNLWEVALGGGPPIPITTGLGPDDAPGISMDGKLLVYAVDDGVVQVFALSDGLQRAISTSGRQDFSQPRVSPDGREVAAIATPWGRQPRIAVVGLEDLETRDLGEGTAVAFSADGSELYVATAGEVRAVPRGSGEARLLGTVPGTVQMLIVGSDGDIHLMVRGETELEGWCIPPGGGAAVREADAPVVLVAPAPAGGWRALVRHEGDDFRVTLRPPGTGEDDSTTLDVPARAANLAWSVDGRFFFHASLDAVFRTEVATGTRTRVAQGDLSNGFDIAPDGETLFVTMMTPHHRRMLITNFGDRARP